VTKPAPRIAKLVVIGVGLIGGSFALALKAAGRVERVVGIGRSRANLDVARSRGIIDDGITLDGDWTRELAGAVVVLLATPVAQFPSLFAAIAPHLPTATILTDAGSTKQNVIAEARAHLKAALPQFVPGHPIAGTEHTGAAAAFATLFRDRNVDRPAFEASKGKSVTVEASRARNGSASGLIRQVTLNDGTVVSACPQNC